MSLVLHEYVVEKLQKILPYEFTTKEEVVKLLKIELAKVKIFDIEELTFAELITAVALSKGVVEREILDTEFTKHLKIYSNFQHISHTSDYIKQHEIDSIKQRYLYDELETKMKDKYDSVWSINGTKITFKTSAKSTLTLVRPFLSEGRVCFDKVFFNAITSEGDYMSMMPEEFIQTKTPKFITSVDSNKARVAECKYLLLDELMWIIDNVEFKLINNKKNAGNKRVVKAK